MAIVVDSCGKGVILNPFPNVVNKKQSPVRKNHFFTFFYPEGCDFDKIVVELKRYAYQGKFQTEVCPSTQRKHLQGMLWCKTACRDSVFKTLKGANFRKLKDVDDVANYCGKDETHDKIFRIAWGYPEPAYVEEIERLYSWQEDVVKILAQEPDKRTLHWYWEANGCTGKTTFQKYVFTHYDNVVVLSGKAADMKQGVICFIESNKTTPRIVLINVPRSAQGFVSYTGLEEIKDMFFYSGKYEGGMVCGKPPHIFVFANEEPDYSKLSLDRFNVRNIAQN